MQAATITNNNLMEAGAGGTPVLNGNLIHHGQIAAAAGGTIRIGDPTPEGSGTITSSTGEPIIIANGFTDAGPTTADAVRLAGGQIYIGVPGAGLANLWRANANPPAASRNPRRPGPVRSRAPWGGEGNCRQFP